MTIKNAFNDIALRCKENPKKYCRMFWYGDNNGLILSNSRIAIKRALLIYQNGDNTMFVDPAENANNKFAIICRPKKHMAVVINTDKDTYYKYFNLKVMSSEEDNEENNNSEIFACIAETETNNTIIIAFVQGVYFVETYDSEYSTTLFKVIKKLISVSNKKEDTYEEAPISSPEEGLQGNIY